MISILFFSCKSSYQSSVYKEIAETGYANLRYRFSDNGNRDLTIFFLNDSIVKVMNNTSIAHNHYLLNFNSSYLYKRGNIGTITVGRLLESDKERPGKTKYAKPYENVSYPLDNKAIEYIFPDMEGETMRFSADFKRLQVKEFSFERVK